MAIFFIHSFNHSFIIKLSHQSWTRQTNRKKSARVQLQQGSELQVGGAKSGMAFAHKEPKGRHKNQSLTPLHTQESHKNTKLKPFYICRGPGAELCWRCACCFSLRSVSFAVLIQRLFSRHPPCIMASLQLPNENHG